MVDRNFLLPRLTNPKSSLRLFTKDNIVNSKIKVYWFPDQQQEDSEDPTYQAPPGTRWPVELNLLRHPKVIRILSASGGPPTDVSYLFSFQLFPAADNHRFDAHLFEQHPEWVVNVSGESLSTGSSNWDFTGFSSGSGGESTYISIEDIVAEVVLSIGTPPEGTLIWVLVPGSFSNVPLETDPTSDPGGWRSAISGMNLPEG